MLSSLGTPIFPCLTHNQLEKIVVDIPLAGTILLELEALAEAERVLAVVNLGGTKTRQLGRSRGVLCGFGWGHRTKRWPVTRRMTPPRPLGWASLVETECRTLLKARDWIGKSVNKPAIRAKLLTVNFSTMG